ncbi:hypothetical protein CMV_025315 [Castanea mollissima]|uniref:Uncharacterized protein n=1 Tax=Castanea mollissima TaxID=60419 RepID=A0A8J4Q578_9ROSI|nr:hypothetical protein CMV_029422 [Castanea mollissima]KAF3948719.1 hypothetical protein CMV_025315 [Castanea mollissima]
MENNQDSSKSPGMCEKIRGAMSDCPIRRFLSRQRDSSRASSIPNSSLPIHNHHGRTIDIQTTLAAHEHPKLVDGSQHLKAHERTKADEVPIEFDYSGLHSPIVKGRSATPYLPMQNISPVRKISPMKEDNFKPPLVPVQENPMLKRQNNGQGVKGASEVEEKQKPKLEAPAKALNGEGKHHGVNMEQQVKKEVKATSVVEEKHKPKLEAPAKALDGEGQHHFVNMEKQVKQEGENPGVDNKTFSDYINRAKKIIRTVTNVGGRHNTSGQDDAYDTKKKDHANDHFSEYINRAKMKIRTTSGIGNGRN